MIRISIQWYIYKCKYKTGGLYCSGTSCFINFWLRFFYTKKETQFLLGWPYIWTHQRAVHPVVFKISVSRDPKILTAAATVENSSSSMVQCQLSTPWFLKSSNSLPISSGHDVIHTPVPFFIHTPVPFFCQVTLACKGYDNRHCHNTMAIVISFACERNLYPMVKHLNS